MLRKALLAMGAICLAALLGATSPQERAYKELRTFTRVLSAIQREYVREVDPRELIYGAIQGMVSKLDPHSAFLTPDQYREMQVETRGRFGGIGIEITVRNGVITVVAPIEDTPAARAGIKAGDRIVRIEGKPTRNMSLMEAVKLMRGKPGTPVTISIMREGWKEPRDFRIVRAVIHVKSVRYRRLGDYGYVRIAQFQEGTAREFREALRKLQAEGRIKGLVLDLRNDPGGLLEEAVKVADEFLDKGLIVYTQGRTPEQRREYRAHPNGAPPWPLVVLVNAGTASGAEIVAGALQDHGRALLVGTKTFGKGSVQTLIPLEGGAGLRLTTAMYYTPKGRCIQAKGIEPDVVVEQAVAPSRPHPFREEDLERHLGRGLPSGGKGDREGPRLEDPQLRVALDLLRVWDRLQGAGRN